MGRMWQVGMLAAAAAVLASPVDVAQAQEKKALILEGSTTVGPIADAFAEVFQKKYPNVTITVNKTGSGDGAAALQDGRCDIAAMSRFMKESEFKACVEKGVMPVAHVVAMDGVCVIVNDANSVRALTSDQVRRIYTGEIKNWKEVGGPDKAIVVISRDTNSGTYETFHEKVMKKAKMAAGTEYVNSNPQAYQRVRTTDGAVGYVGLGFIKDGVHALQLDGVMPTMKTIASGQYPASRPLFMFTNGYPDLGGIVHAFVTFHLTEQGQELIEDKDFVPVTDY